MNKFFLEIITPERIAYTDQVEMVTASTPLGTIGILPHHVALFTRLEEGEVKIIKEGSEIFLGIGGGFMEVSKEKVIILVTEAIHADEINEQEVLLAKERAQAALLAKPAGEALASAQALFRRSTLALKLLGRKRKKIVAS